METQVMKPSGLRPGKGFSLSEVHKVGLTVHQVRKLGIYVDPRRRTLHEFNVQNLKMLVEERKRQLEEEAEITRVERKKIEEEMKAEKKKKEEKKKAKKSKEKKAEEKIEKKKEEKIEKKKEEKIEKKKEEKIEKKKEEKIEKKKEGIDLTQISGIGKKKYEEFKSAGILTVEDLLDADTKELSENTTFSTEYIEKLKDRARSL
jgi:predicted flap endonuclease-1-like 5' DNA nuclease